MKQIISKLRSPNLKSKEWNVVHSARTVRNNTSDKGHTGYMTKSIDIRKPQLDWTITKRSFTLQKWGWKRRIGGFDYFYSLKHYSFDLSRVLLVLSFFLFSRWEITPLKRWVGHACRPVHGERTPSRVQPGSSATPLSPVFGTSSAAPADPLLHRSSKI